MQMILMSLMVLAADGDSSFVLTWREQSAGVPPIHEEFTVSGDEVTYKRLPEHEIQRASLKRSVVVHELAAKLPAGKTKGEHPLNASLKSSAKAVMFTGPVPVKADDAAIAWVKLRDELRVSLGLIPDAARPRPTSVGVATLQPNGDLWMKLYAAEPGMPIAEALQIVKPGDPQYTTYLKHLGGLKPGESKPIPPFD